MRAAVLPLLVLSCCAIRAQEWRPCKAAELIAKLDSSAAGYKAMPSYQVRSMVSVYRGVSESTPSETAESHVWKIGGKAKAKHMGMISYEDDRTRVTIDPEERWMMVADAEGTLELFGSEYRESVLDAAAIGRSSDATATRYRVRYGPGSDFELIEFQFDKAGWLRRMEAHWGQPVSVHPDLLVSARFTPRVVMEVGLPERITQGQVTVDMSEVIRFENGTPVPSAAYAGYEIIDNRYHR